MVNGVRSRLSGGCKHVSRLATKVSQASGGDGGHSLFHKCAREPFVLGQTATADSAGARIYVDSRRTIAPFDRNMFGSFLEHLGRAIYEGIYDPGSALSDANGFRKDVMEEVRQIGSSDHSLSRRQFRVWIQLARRRRTKEDRPRILDKAWNTIDTNQFGLNEFMAWCKIVGSRPLMGLNLGTGTAEELRPSSNTATSRREPSGVICGAATELTSLTRWNTGAWAMRWTVPGKLGT